MKRTPAEFQTASNLTLISKPNDSAMLKSVFAGVANATGPSLEGFIQRRKHQFLIDSGAEVSIISQKHLPTPLLPSGNPIRIVGISGSFIWSLGTTDITIILNNKKLVQRFVVVSQNVPTILGIDFLQGNECTIDFSDSAVEFRGKKIPLRIAATDTSILMTAHEEVLPSNSEVVFPIPRPPDLREGSVLAEPCDHHQLPKGVFLARTFSDKTQGQMVVRVINTNEQEVTLHKDLIIGRACNAEICNPVATDARDTSHLRELLNAHPDSLTCDERKRFQSLILSYKDIFSAGPLDQGRTNLIKHSIDTGSSSPIKIPPRRIPLSKREEVTELVTDMHKRNVIEPCNGPWASPVVLVKKKDGSYRFCVDYRLLNDKTRKDSYPLPRMDDLFSTLAGAKWFSTMDLQSGYWQVEMEERDKEKTAFTTGDGLWQFNVMPFGLCNAPATFERLMDKLFQGMSWQTMLIYLDDIIAYSISFDDHLAVLEQIFNRLRAANLKLNPTKCHFLQKKVKYLGHIVSENGLVTDPDKVKAVTEWPIPQNKKNVRSFLGLCSYYRRFIQGFSTLAKPLSELTEENRRFSWNSSCEDAFMKLKTKLTTAPVLAFPTPNEVFILDTDASNVGVGSVLSQKQGEHEVVIEYFSKTLSRSERNYCVTRRELLAVVLAVRHFHHYLFGRAFVLRTDHASLRWLCNFKQPEGQMARWLENLQQYDFMIQHRPGSKHTNADALSRRLCGNCKQCSRAEELEEESSKRALVTTVSGSLEEEQRKDPTLSLIIKWLEDGKRPPKPDILGQDEDVKSYWAIFDQLTLENGTLIRRWEETPGNFLKLIVVPRPCVKAILTSLHDSPSGGHLGQKKTLSKIKKRYFWFGRTVDAKVWCLTCEICAARRGPQRKTRGALQPSLPGCPFERIAIDILGPFPRTKDGNRYIVVVMDYFTKWPECFAVPNQTAEVVLSPLINEVFCRFGVPQVIHSDQGRNFEADVFQSVLKILGVEKTRTTPLHPQSDGMVERFNRTLLDYLSKFVDRQQTDWDRHLQPALLSYRSAEHEASGFSPAYLNLGRELKLPADLAFGSPKETAHDVPLYALELKERLHKTHKIARENLHLAASSMKTRYDLKKNQCCFIPGDDVWFYNPKRKKGVSPKLQSDWEGPAQVKARLSDLVYRIQCKGQRKQKVIHVDRLAPYSCRAGLSRSHES